MFKVFLSTSKGYYGSNLNKLVHSLALFEKSMNHDLLRTMILNFTSPLGLQFANNAGLNNQEVYEKLLSGNEHYDDTVDYQADLHLVLVKKRKPLFSKQPAIGYGNHGQKEIYTYTWYFNEAEPHDLAGHIAHEWAHKVGFEHDYHYTKHRQYSVPYAFGYIINDICQKIN